MIRLVLVSTINQTQLVKYVVPCLALSSENSLATSLKLMPLLSFATASSFLACLWRRSVQFLRECSCLRERCGGGLWTKHSYYVLLAKNVPDVDALSALLFAGPFLSSCVLTLAFGGLVLVSGFAFGSHLDV